MTSCHLLDLDFSYLLAVVPFFPATFLIPGSEKLPHFQPERLFLFFETVSHPHQRRGAFFFFFSIIGTIGTITSPLFMVPSPV